MYLIEKRGTFLHKMLEGNLIHIHIIHCYNEGVTWNVGQGDTQIFLDEDIIHSYNEGVIWNVGQGDTWNFSDADITHH